MFAKIFARMFAKRFVNFVNFAINFRENAKAEVLFLYEYVGGSMTIHATAGLEGGGEWG
jgi:hypothetical protein